MESHTVDTNPRGTESELSTSTAFELVSNDRRRLVVEILSEHDEPVTLAEFIAEIERRDVSVAADGSDVLRMELHHCHLPKLADAGLVRYDRETNRVTPLPALGRFADTFDFEAAGIAARASSN